MKVKFFYRDADNYKCSWVQEVDNDTWNDFVQQFIRDGENIEDYLDKDFESDNLYQIKEFDMSMHDIPLLQECGLSESDHDYVSIVDFGNHLTIK